jgi:hypothetical protein
MTCNFKLVFQRSYFKLVFQRSYNVLPSDFHRLEAVAEDSSDVLLIMSLKLLLPSLVESESLLLKMKWFYAMCEMC